MTMEKKIFVIEHLEPKLWKWSLAEYKNISKIIGKNNLWFTNVKKESKKLLRYGKVIKNPVKKLNLRNVCILDPNAKKTLTPQEARKFSFFIFGGILGDDPPKKRTEKELSFFMPSAKKRNIGKEQMSTDNAVFAVKEIVRGNKIEELDFKDKIEIKINKIESVVLPYRYLLIKGKPLVSKDVVDYLKRKKGF